MALMWTVYEGNGESHWWKIVFTTCLKISTFNRTVVRLFLLVNHYPETVNIVSYIISGIYSWNSYQYSTLSHFLNTQNFNLNVHHSIYGKPFKVRYLALCRFVLCLKIFHQHPVHRFLSLENNDGLFLKILLVFYCICIDVLIFCFIYNGYKNIPPIRYFWDIHTSTVASEFLLCCFLHQHKHYLIQ